MADPETEEPLKGEAEAQDEQTTMPWIWGGLGLLVIAAFVAAGLASTLWRAKPRAADEA